MNQYSEKIKKIANIWYDTYLDKELCKEFFIGTILEPWDEKLWKKNKMDTPTQAEAELAFACLKESGRIFANLTEIKHCPDIKHEDECMFYPTDHYPNTLDYVREFKLTAEYKEWRKKNEK